jgi:tetrahydromethanopterin S-methyltransferase subunit G
MAEKVGVPKPEQPYFGSVAQKHNDYLCAANEAANAVEQVYAFMQGHSKSRDGKPLKIRDANELEELKREIKKAEKAVQTVLQSYAQDGKNLDADYAILYAQARLMGSVQAKYNKIKADITEGLKYEKEISDYDIEQALMAAKQRKSSVETDLQSIKGEEKHLFKY